MRLSPAAHRFICRMDGRRTVNELWEELDTEDGSEEDQPTQEQIISLLAQLHSSDLLHGATPPDMDEVAERAQRNYRRQLISRIKNPMAVRLPLIDPDDFLDRTHHIFRPIFGRVGFLLWALLVLTGAVFGVVNWTPFVSDVTASAFSAQNILLIILIYPVIKIIHELGHAYAAKAWGAEVHEMGVMLLILMPVPYVDASSASAFPKKSNRAIVALAGIMVEAALAALAMIFWVFAEPGLGRAIAFNVVLIGGISTILFNGNPLLKFDGYYAFADYIEIPNLATRANKYFLYLLKQKLLKVDAGESPVSAPGEAPWFLGYSVSAYLYRLFITFGIALYIADQLFVIGILLAIWAVFNAVGLPLVKGVNYLVTSPMLRHKRKRAYTICGAGLTAAFVLLTVVPLPYATSTQGVIQLPEEASVAVRTNGFIDDILVANGETVQPGTPLVRMVDTTLGYRYQVQQKELEELTLREQANLISHPVQARLFTEQLRHAKADLDLTAERLGDLVLTADKSGIFIIPRAEDLPGQFARQGDIMGYVVAREDPVVRVAVPQSSIDLVRQRTKSVTAIRIEDLQTEIAATIIRAVPMAQTELPSAALGTQGGGDILIDPEQSGKPQALEGLFNIDLALADQPDNLFVGSRVHVRFDHGYEPILFRVVRSVRQLFLRQFGV